jgi:DNA adenine methylase
MRPALKYHGGKAYQAKRIVSMLPAHDVYVEPFAGGLNVLLNKRRARTEVAGDLNADLIQFYICLRDNPGALIARLSEIPYARESFEDACGIVDHPRAKDYFDAVERAAAFLVKTRFSRDGLGRTFSDSDRFRGGRPGDANAWRTIQPELHAIAARLRKVDFHHADALDLIERFDSPGTLFYLDPPYVHSTRTALKTYQYEMSDEGHLALLDAIANVRGMVVLSGYPSSLYDQSLRSWERHEFGMPNHSGQTKVKQRRTEVIWMNQACDRFALS